MKRWKQFLMALAVLTMFVPFGAAQAWPCWGWFGCRHQYNYAPAPVQAQPQQAQTRVQGAPTQQGQVPQQAQRTRRSYRSYSYDYDPSEQYIAPRRYEIPFYMRADHKIRGF